MGETVEAIGYKADVKSRVKNTIVEKKDALVGGADSLVSRVSDAVGDKVRETGQEALDRTKGVAREAVDSARETVEERTGDEAQQMASSLRDKAQEVGSSSAS
jgi:DNA anti-recombination protein RmuC